MLSRARQRKAFLALLKSELCNARKKSMNPFFFFYFYIFNELWPPTSSSTTQSRD